MKWNPKNPPRKFEVGLHAKVVLRDCGRLRLKANEQVTFVTESGAEHDVVRKDWGFYATASLNGRLKQFGLRSVLVRSPLGKYYVWLVERKKMKAFQGYLKAERHRIVKWLDQDAALEGLDAKKGRKKLRA